MPDNGCNTDGCNVLQIVNGQLNGMVELQQQNTKGILQLINEKFDAIKDYNVREAERINELRKGDLEAVKIANDSQVKRAELLSQQLVENADTVRKSNETLASTIAASSKQVTDKQDEKITRLEQTGWVSSGKEGASPDIQSLVTDLVNLKNANANSAGVSTGQQLTTNKFIAILTIAIMVISMIVLLINFFRG